GARRTRPVRLPHGSTAGPRLSLTDALRLGPFGCDAVSRRPVTNTSDDPRHEVLLGPHEVVNLRLAPRYGGERFRLHRIKIVVYAQRIKHHSRDSVVAERREVQPVGCPHLGIL